MNDQFVFTDRLKKIFYVLMGIGALALIIGIIKAASGHGHWADKVWSNILVNNMFFLGISLTGIFLVAAHYLGYAGWYVAFKRIPEAMSMWLPFAGIIMLIIVIGMVADWHHIYSHWTKAGLTDVNADNYDPIIAAKEWYLNKGGYVMRFAVYFGLWILFARLLRKASLNEDIEGGLKWYKKSKVYSSIFLIIFAVSTSMMSWDFVMSIDAHWYSTLFGWYNFASYLVAGVAFITLITMALKKSGYLPNVNIEHFHDLGKMMFAFSILWTYLWFSQFMLIWYANIGEETIYFRARLDNYPILFWVTFIINFLVPLFVLMTRDAKRNYASLGLVAIVIIIGHWLDYYQMIIPGSTHNHVHFGLFEMALGAGFLGLFLFVVYKSLAKAPLTAKNHPFLKESIEHHT